MRFTSGAVPIRIRKRILDHSMRVGGQKKIAAGSS